MLRLAGVLGALLCALVAASPARAGDEFPDRPPEPGPNARLAVETVSKVRDVVDRRWPSCRFVFPERKQSFTDQPVPAAVAAAFGALRRPQTQVEASLAATVPAESGLGLAIPAEVPRSSVRIVRSLADGTQLRLFATLDQNPPRPRPAVCRTRELRELRPGRRELPPQARRAALRLMRAIHEAERRSAQAGPSGPGVYVTAVRPELGFGLEVAGTSLDVVRASGASTVVRRSGHSLLVLLVPDGVARVEVVLARGRSPFTDRRYLVAERHDGAVLDNVAAIPVNRPTADVWVTRQTWRASDGSEVPRREPEGGFIIFVSR